MGKATNSRKPAKKSRGAAKRPGSGAKARKPDKAAKVKAATKVAAANAKPKPIRQAKPKPSIKASAKPKATAKLVAEPVARVPRDVPKAKVATSAVEPRKLTVDVKPVAPPRPKPPEPKVAPARVPTGGEERAPGAEGTPPALPVPIASFTF
jgi:hypothetical protein